MQTNNTKAHTAVLIGTFIVATTFPIGQKIAPTLNPVLIVLFRFLISVLLMLPLFFFTDKIKVPTLKRFIQFCTVGICYSGFFIFMFTSLRYTTSLNTSVIYTLVPAMAAVIGFVFLKVKLKSINYILIPLGIVSTLWVILNGNLDSFVAFNLNKGDLIFGTGCILTACYSTLLKKFHIKESPLNMAFWSMLCGSFFLIIYSLITVRDVQLASVPTETFLWIIYLSVMTIFTSYIWAFANPILGATHTLAYSYSIPTFVLLINWILNSTLPPLIILPGVFSGLIIMVWLQLSRDDSTVLSKCN